MKRPLYLEERVSIAYDMLNETPTLYDGLGLKPKAREKLARFTRQVLSVLVGIHEAVPEKRRTHLRSRPTTDIAERLANWKLSGSTGLSSECLADVMILGRGTGLYPMDSADFGRCHRLLGLVPEWLPRLPEIAIAHPGVWSELVHHWADLAEMYEAGDFSTLYAELRACERRGHR